MDQHTTTDMGAPILWSDFVTQHSPTLSEGDDIVIPHGTHVVLDSVPPELGTLVIHGSLEFGEADLTLAANNIIVFGELVAGSEAKPHPYEVNIVLTGTEVDPDVVLSELAQHWTAPHAGHAHLGHSHDPINNKALLVAAGGKLSLHGQDKASWTQLDATVHVGDQEMTVLDAEGWHVGDLIAIAPTGFDPHEVEERTITAIDGNTITLDAPLEHMHFGAEQDLGGGQTLDMRAEVANLSRSITIEGRNEGERETVADERGNEFEVGYGGHTMFHEDASIQVSGVEFTGLGITGEKGNYPVHFHLAGDMQGSYIEDSAIHHSLQRGLIVHRTDNLLIEGNVIYDTVGHQFYLEDGNEEGNQFLGNLAMLPRPTPDALQIETLGNLEDSFGERASAFWITNQGNDFVGNHAVGIEYGMGFWYRLPDLPDGQERHPHQERGFDDPLPGLNQDNVVHTAQVPPSLYLVSYGPAWQAVAFDMQAAVGSTTGLIMIERPQIWNVENIGIALGRETDAVIEPITAGVGRHYFISPGKGYPGRVVEIDDPTFIGQTDNPATNEPLDYLNGNQETGVLFENQTGVRIEVTGGRILGDETLTTVNNENFYTDRVGGFNVQFLEGADGTVISEIDHPNIFEIDGEGIYRAGAGNDQLWGSDAGDQIFLGQAGNDLLAGGPGDDILIGGSGDDLLLDKSRVPQRGDENDDVFLGGTGNDRFELRKSKTDHDTFIYRKGDGEDVIDGFRGDTDKIVLIGFTRDDLEAAAKGNGFYDFGNGDSIDLGSRALVQDGTFELLGSEAEATCTIATALALGFEAPQGPDPQPEPDPQPDPEPDQMPAPVSPAAIFTATTSTSPKVFDHAPEMEIENGVIAFSINANALSGRQGLFSKDARGFGEGGHITIWADGDEVLVRLQAEKKSYSLEGGALTVGVQHEVAVSFGPDGLNLIVDGQFVGTSAYTGGLAGNKEPIVIGANQWASSAETADDIIDPFDGIVGNVQVIEQQLSPSDIAALQDANANLSGSDPAPDPEPEPLPDPEPTNEAPFVVIEETRQNVAEGSSAEIDVAHLFRDPEADGLEYRISSGPDFLSIDGSTLTVAPGFEDSGTYFAQIVAFDGEFESEATLVEYNVLNTPQPDPDPGPNPDPTPGSEQATPVFAQGSSTVQSVADVQVFDHSSVYETAEGVISLTITPQSLGGVQGLFSKDARSFGDGGHLTLWANGDEVELRLQSDGKSYSLNGGTLTNGGTHDIAISFGADGLKLFVDGVVVDSSDYTGGLAGNAEPIVIGASQWGSRAETADKIEDPFVGVIDAVQIFDQQLDEAAVVALGDGAPSEPVGPGPDPQPDPQPDPDPQPEPDPEPEQPVSEGAQELLAAKGIFSNKGTEPQEWGDGVYVSGFNVDGEPAPLGFRSQDSLSDRPEFGFGVKGLRLNQQTGYDREADASERVEIDFRGGVEDLSFRVSHLGVDEGPEVDGVDLPETGIWTALDANGDVLGTGKIGPETSVDGLHRGTYGTYTFAVDVGAPVYSLALEATEFGHGESGFDFSNYDSHNSSEFGIQALSYTRVDASAAQLEDEFIFLPSGGAEDAVAAIGDEFVGQVVSSTLAPTVEVIASHEDLFLFEPVLSVDDLS